MDWKDYPIECVVLFHTRVKKFMQQLLLSPYQLLGKLKEYIIHYEVQHCGLLHAHIILWVVEDDVQWITNEIIAFIPATLNENVNEFQEPIDPMQMAFYKMVMRKQLHIYGNKCNHKTFQNQCKYGFPFNAHSKHHSKFNNYMNRWEYYQPRYEDCNVVPYHESLLLLWGVYLNIQCIISSYWSYYLFKYVMKCEPHGTINLNKKNQNV